MSNVKIKKVKAYPIPAKMTVGTSPETVSGQVLKLNQRGFLIEANVPAWKTGDKFSITFELPVLHKVLNEACVVVKLYTSTGAQVIEGHFQSITQDGEGHIMRFLASMTKAES